MVRYRKVKDYGTAGWKINLLASDVKDLGIKDGDMVDIEDVCFISEQLYNVKVKRGQK